MAIDKRLSEGGGWYQTVIDVGNAGRHSAIVGHCVDILERAICLSNLM